MLAFSVHCRRYCLVCGLDIVGTKDDKAGRLKAIQENLRHYRRIHGSVDRNLDILALFAPGERAAEDLTSAGGMVGYLGRRCLLVCQKLGAHEFGGVADGPKGAGAAKDRGRSRGQDIISGIDHGVVSFDRLSIRAVLWDFALVNCQITIRRLLAISVIAGLLLAPLSRPVMAGTTPEASMWDRRWRAICRCRPCRTRWQATCRAVPQRPPRRSTATNACSWRPA